MYLRWSTCENYSMLSKYPYKSQPWYTIKQKLKDVFVTWSLQVDCGIVLKSAHLQHETKAFKCAAGLLLLFQNSSSTNISSSLRSEMRWWKLPAEGLFFRRFFTGGETCFLKQEKSHIPVKATSADRQLGRKSDQGK